MIRRLALFGGWQLTDKVYYADSYEGTSYLLAEERTPQLTYTQYPPGKIALQRLYDNLMKFADELLVKQ